jgi:orotidine-5'-phosphate decarboxylase
VTARERARWLRPGAPLSRVAVALDTADWDELVTWCGIFGPRVGVLKVGLEAFVRFGPRAVELAVAAAPAVFLDLKLHDIPNTVAGAARVAGEAGVALLTVHAGGGGEMVAAAVEAAGPQVAVLAVTVLTSLDDVTLGGLGMPGTAAERASAWCSLAARAGAAGVVCSPRELTLLRTAHPAPFLLVTPGIRPAGEDSGDQRRTATPAAAAAAGADLLVVGRPLTRAADPGAALAALERELAAYA